MLDIFKLCVFSETTECFAPLSFFYKVLNMVMNIVVVVEQINIFRRTHVFEVWDRFDRGVIIEVRLVYRACSYAAALSFYLAFPEFIIVVASRQKTCQLA